MMRVCYINRPGLGVINGTGNIGGGQLQNLFEAMELSQDKFFDVHMLVEGDSRNKFKHHRITVHVIPKKNAVADFFQTCAIFKEIAADIYLARMPTRQQIIYEPLICKILGRKYAYAEIADPHFILERPWIAQQMYRTGLKMASLVISNATNIKEKLAAYTRQQIININVPIFSTETIKRKREHILWVGRPIKLKRPELFLELARRFPKEKFVMLIAGEYTAQLPPNVTVKYNVNNKNINRHYAASKMLVQTSSSEGFGNVYLEAWINKTPVASMLNPDGVLTKYNTGLHSESFEELVKNVKLLLTDKKKWKKCSENGYKYVIKHHDLRTVMKKYKELFTRHVNQAYF